MSAIYENLKQLRKSQGLTQEEVAQRLGVTRQAISSYESNRTQPDLETLKRLADIFQVDLFDLLYGTSRAQRQRQTIRRAGALAFADLLLSNILRCGVFCITNRRFPMPEGPVSQAEQPLLDLHLALSRLVASLEWWTLLSFGLCCVVLLLLLVGMERPVALTVQVKYWLLLAACTLAVSFLWSCFDPIFGPANYLYPVLPNLVHAALAIILGQLGQRFAHPKTNSPE